MGLPGITRLFVIIFAAPALLDAFPTRTTRRSDCLVASTSCWCQKEFARCWGPYSQEGIGQTRDQIKILELQNMTSEEVMLFIKEMTTLQELRIGEGINLDCTCDVIDAFVENNVTLINRFEVPITNCKFNGWNREKMTAVTLAKQCCAFYIMRYMKTHYLESRDRRSFENDDVMKRSSARKGAKPAGYDMDQGFEMESTEEESHPQSDLFNFLLRPRRSKRSLSDMDDEEVDHLISGRSRQRRTGVTLDMQESGMMAPAAMAQQGGNYAPMGQPGQGYGNPVPGQTRVAEAEGSDVEEYSSVSDEGGETINADLMERIRAILGATKIDLPVDINDPYDLGLLLRHLRHHSNLLANIGDPEVRNQVLAAMQEEEQEEEQDATNAVRDEVLNNVNTNQGATPYGGRGPYRGQEGMAPPAMRSQPGMGGANGIGRPGGMGGVGGMGNVGGYNNYAQGQTYGAPGGGYHAPAYQG